MQRVREHPAENSRSHAVAPEAPQGRSPSAARQAMHEAAGGAGDDARRRLWIGPTRLHGGHWLLGARNCVQSDQSRMQRHLRSSVNASSRQGDSPPRDPTAMRAELVRAMAVRPDPILAAPTTDDLQLVDDGTAWSVGSLLRSARHRIAAAPPTSTAEARLSSCTPMPPSIIATARPRAANYPAKAAGAVNSAIPARCSGSARERDRSSTITCAAIAPPRPASAARARP